MKSNLPSQQPEPGPQATVPDDLATHSMSPEEWTARQEIEKRFAHAHRRRFGLNNTPEDRRMRDQWAFLASFIVTETVRYMDATDPEVK